MASNYQIIESHKGAHITMPPPYEDTLDGAVNEARELAQAGAQLGHDCFYRVFGPDGYVTAFGCFEGKVREHRDVTIPKNHW